MKAVCSNRRLQSLIRPDRPLIAARVAKMKAAAAREGEDRLEDRPAGFLDLCERLLQVLAVEDKPLVSVDFMSNPHSSIVDSLFTRITMGLIL